MELRIGEKIGGADSEPSNEWVSNFIDMAKKIGPEMTEAVHPFGFSWSQHPMKEVKFTFSDDEYAASMEPDGIFHRSKNKEQFWDGFLDSLVLQFMKPLDGANSEKSN